MKVEIVSIQGVDGKNATEIIAKAARTCYRSRSKDIEEKREEFINGQLITNGHLTPIEFIDIIFDVSGVSRSLLAQITRHRHASFCVESQRYVKYEKNDDWCPNIDYIIPPILAENGGEAMAEYIRIHDHIKSVYEKLILMNIKTEDARFVLPNSMCTNFMFKMNLSSLRNFINLRLDKHAQWEIRELAKKIYDLLKENNLDYIFNDIIKRKNKD